MSNIHLLGVGVKMIDLGASKAISLHLLNVIFLRFDSRSRRVTFVLHSLVFDKQSTVLCCGQIYKGISVFTD